MFPYKYTFAAFGNDRRFPFAKVMLLEHYDSHACTKPSFICSALISVFFKLLSSVIDAAFLPIILSSFHRHHNRHDYHPTQRLSITLLTPTATNTSQLQMMDDGTFHPFPRLPFELREQIWQDAAYRQLWRNSGRIR
jgi:hypothetical protein